MFIRYAGVGVGHHAQYHLLTSNTGASTAQDEASQPVDEETEDHDSGREEDGAEAIETDEGEELSNKEEDGDNYNDDDDIDNGDNGDDLDGDGDDAFEF